MEILEQFGVEWKLLIVQLINFLIFILIFRKFVLPKLKGFMDERAKGIKDSLKDAEQARRAAEQAEVERQQTLATAVKEADRVLADAREQAAAQGEELVAQAKAEAARVIADGTAQLEADRTALRTELRAELGALTVATTRKVLEGMVSKADHSKMVKTAERRIGKRVAR